MVPESYYVGLSAILFTIGVVGVVIRRNPLVMFMSIELMLNAANLALGAFGPRRGRRAGAAAPARHAPDPPLRGEGGGGLRPGQGRRVPPPLHRRGGGRGRRHLGPPRRRLRDLRLPRSRPLPRQGRRPEA